MIGSWDFFFRDGIDTTAAPAEEGNYWGLLGQERRGNQKKRLTSRGDKPLGIKPPKNSVIP